MNNKDSSFGTNDHRPGTVFVVPALSLLILLNVFPLLYNVLLSFTDAELTGGSWRWVGLANYASLGQDPDYARALLTTAFFTLWSVGLELILGFSLAMVLKDKIRLKPLILTLLLVPMMLSPAVMGLYGAFMLNGQYGIVNQVLSLLGLPQPQWISDPSLKLLSVLMVDIWMWTPYMMLISLAGLNSIPGHLYEAAEIDRASPRTVFFRITLPLSAPFLFLAALFRATDALKQFDLVMAMTGPGDPATQTLSTLLYQKIFQASRVGLGSAYACLVLLIVIVLATLVVKNLDRVKKSQGRA